MPVSNPRMESDWNDDEFPSENRHECVSAAVETGSFHHIMEQRQLPDLMFLLGLPALIYHSSFSVRLINGFYFKLTLIAQTPVMFVG